MKVLKWLKRRATEPSSAAGVAVIITAIPSLLVNPMDQAAWAAVIASVFAIAKGEGGGSDVDV